MWGEYFHACERIVEVFGRSAPVAILRPADFGMLRAKLAETLGPVALRKYIPMTRTVFGYAYNSELIEVPVRYGSSFDPPTRRVMRLARANRGAKLISAAIASMGHADHSMAGHYRESIGDDRLQRIVDHLRNWLLSDKPKPVE